MPEVTEGKTRIEGELTPMQEDWGYWLEEDGEGIYLMKASGGGPPPPPPRIVNRVAKSEGSRKMLVNRLISLIKG